MRQAQEKWTDEFLEEMRSVGDAIADETVDEIFRAGQVAAVNLLLGELVRNDQLPPVGLPARVYQYLEQTALPPELDRAKIARAEHLFLSHGNLALAVLLCASLPECYVQKRGVRVLWLTQRLKEHVFRRLLETCQMVLAVMSKGGLSASGRGLRAAQKVRLMHAAIRRLILAEPDTSESAAAPRNFGEVLAQVRWDEAELGYPINQQELAYTLLTFSHVILRGWETMGVQITSEDKDAFVYCWSVVGRVMGIREDLLAENHQEAAELFGRIKRLSSGSSPEGQAMTQSLITCMEEVVPGRALDSLPRHLMRALLGEETASLLGIKPLNLIERLELLAVMKTIEFGALAKHKSNEELLITPILWQWFSQRLLARLCNLGQPPGWNRTLFQIPAELAQSWKLPNRS
jgi:hypothetical protein